MTTLERILASVCVALTVLFVAVVVWRVLPAGGDRAVTAAASHLKSAKKVVVLGQEPAPKATEALKAAQTAVGKTIKPAAAMSVEPATAKSVEPATTKAVEPAAAKTVAPVVVAKKQERQAAAKPKAAAKPPAESSFAMTARTLNLRVNEKMALAVAESNAKRKRAKESRKAVVGENTELETAADADGAMFSISVDGEQVAGTPKPVDRKRKTDLDLADVDIQVKFDGLEVKPMLNVSTVPMRQSYRAGERIDFLATWNYPGWIDAAEIRILDANAQGRSAPLEVLAVGLDGVAAWTMPDLNPGEGLLYVLRVYDRDGRFDETVPLPLTQSEEALAQHRQDGPEVAPGYGEDRTAIRNIPVTGGSITVYGRRVPKGHRVTALGEDVPVDAEGAFVIQRIVPPGDHAVDVAVTRKGRGLTFTREVNVPSSEWFYIAMADLTAGYRFGSKHIEDVKPGEFDKVYTKGRLAFYVKGKIKGKYLLTAAADTGEDKIENLFKGMDGKDPRQFLRRIDPDTYYPVYGDDSSAIEDAPTRGKFYVRVDRGDSHVMWGNFKANINGTEFLRNERALYGGSGVYRSPDTTASGERRTQVDLYAAQPGTLPQHDMLRGTGGSAYFLKHQDVTPGSETVSVEIRDNVTGFVKSRTTLQDGEDYDIVYFQGLILLKQPLASSIGGDEAYLAVSYEYTPAAGDVDGYVYGGRAQQWLGDRLRVAVTGMSEKTGPADQLLYGSDILLRHSDGTYLTAEIARSEGPGFGAASSFDGGLTISDTVTAGKKGDAANAYRVRGRLALEDMTQGAAKGDLEGYYERKEAGFSSLQADTTKREQNWGLRGGFDLSDTVILKFAYDEQQVAGGKRDREFEAGAEFAFDDRWTVGPYARHSDRTLPDGDADQQGSRSIAGALLRYDFDKDTQAYVFAHATVERSGGRRRDDRVGIGGKTLVTEKVGLSAEISGGSEGIGGRAQIDYRPTADDHYYIGYTLDPFRSQEINRPFKLSGRDWGAFVAGARHNFNDRLSMFAEDSYDVYGRHRTLAQTYGVNYTPNASWAVAGALEVGEIEDDTINADTGVKNSGFDRTAVSASLGYRDGDRINARLKGELRVEDSEDNTRDRTSYLAGFGVVFKPDDVWRVLLNTDVVISDASDTLLDGDFVETSLGFAYRPVSNDRLNALVKYSFLYDLPGPDQVTVNGTTDGPAQRSHILTADVSYDVTKALTLGAKYGARFGEIKDRSGAGGWEESSAHLAILRADLHIVHDWDVLVEGRALWTPETDQVRWGLLAGVYRHLGENVKIGVGYNFGRFSDDLRDLTYDDQGVFVNVVGKL